MTTGKSNTSLLWLVLLLGFSGIWELQHTIDARRAALHQEEDDLVLRSGTLLKAMSLEYAPLMADLYWTRVVQYYGFKHASQDANIELLWPLLDVTTTLDPNLIVAYRFGSTFLSEPPPRGAGKPQMGIQLLERGIHANPEFWRFYEDLGLIYYFDLNDYHRAPEAFLEGSKKPGALIWMKTFAAKISEQGETRETSVMLWSAKPMARTPVNAIAPMCADSPIASPSDRLCSPRPVAIARESACGLAVVAPCRRWLKTVRLK